MNDCCFKGSSMGLKVHTNSKTTPRCPKYRGVVLLFVWQKFRADLNLWAINLKFLQILENYVTYNFRGIALKLTHVDLCQDQGKNSNYSPISKVPGSHLKSAITIWKSNNKKIKRPMGISNGTRMNWSMKKTGCKKTRETVPLNSKKVWTYLRDLLIWGWSTKNRDRKSS